MPRMGSLSRRSFVALAAAQAGWPAFAAAGTADRLPTVEEMGHRVADLLALLGESARVERLGRSRGGRAIDLISVGRGARSALIVGAPHANEPIGCVTILTLLERLAHDRAFRERSDFTWHFIPAIDIDGVAMNQGWFSGPRTLRNYADHFFRPAFIMQPEYTFPLKMPGYEFDAGTPENLCWRRALEITRPDLQCSLHGEDTGGVFYIISKDRPRLAQALARQPAASGFALDDLGEVGATTVSYAPGVFAFPDNGGEVRDAIAAGKDPRSVWGAGASSADFAAATYGTFSMTCEIPIWSDPRLFSRAASATTMADVVKVQIAQAREDARLLAASATLIHRKASSLEAAALDASLIEAGDGIAEKLEGLERRLPTVDAKLRLPQCDLVEYEPGPYGIRTPAMVARRARLAKDGAIYNQAQEIVSARIAGLLAKTRLRPIPYRESSHVQMQAILTSAALLD
jgi:hypothetical protein